MKNNVKTRDHALEELEKSNRRISELEKSETGYKKAEKAFQKSEQELNAIINGARDGIALLDKTGKILRINKYIVEIGGFAEKEIVGKRFHTLKMFPLKSITKMITVFSKLLKGEEISYEMEGNTKKGEKKIIQIHNSFLKKDGKVEGIIAILRDITDQKQAEKEIEAKNELLENLILQSPLPTFVLDDKGIYLVVNEAFQKLYAVPDKNMILGSNALTEPENIKYGVDKYIKEALKGNETDIPWIEFISPYDSKKVFVKVKMFPIFATKGNLTNVVVIQEDITDHRQAEEALRESEEKFRNLTATAQDTIIMMNNDGNVSYWNEAAEKMLGYTQEEAIGKEVHKLIAQTKYYSDFSKRFEVFCKTGKGPVIGKTKELVGLRKDGNEFPVELSLSAIKIKGKWNATAIIRDISDRKQTEEALREKEIYTRAIIDQSPISIQIFNKDGLTLDTNKAWGELWQLPSDELIGKYNVLKDEYAREIGGLDDIEKAFKGETSLPYEIEYDPVKSGNSGRKRYIKCVVFPIKNDNGEVNRVVLMHEDITEHKKAEAELAKHREHLEELVQERTKELEEKNKELKHFNDLFVGREFRIKELKDQVQQLEEKFKKLEDHIENGLNDN